MSNVVSNNLTKEKIQQLLSAVGSRANTEDSQIETREHNWREPHYFNGKQLAGLGVFTENLAAAVAEKFSSFCRSTFEAEVVSAKQYFVNNYIEESSKDEREIFYLAFDSDKGNRLGLLGIPEPTAVVWAKQLLGDDESQESGEKQLSELEKSLLLDLASAVVSAFSQTYSDGSLQPAERLVSGQFPLEIQAAEELCKISFNIKQPDDGVSNEAFFLVPCSKLEPVVGTKKKVVSGLSKENISGMIREHLEQLSVCVSVRLACAELSFEEMMNLQVNDVLLLDKKVHEPLEVILDGQTVCCGWPVKSNGKYAVTISSTAVKKTA
ncbi:MAG: FliM/FliN family flagellar motor switch protein [Sedimentisphaerales bacterium]|nr:FliM/FliN family flagellar motor switch protein [Sedimentisphaerales bacterium]